MSTVTPDPEGRDVPGVVHRQRSPYYDVLADHIWYPTSPMQVRQLVGKLLTHLDAMALPDRAHRAARTLIVQEMWRWWDEVCDNAVTSTEGCLAPVVARPHGRYVEGEPSSNRWGWQSEQDWLKAQAPEAAEFEAAAREAEAQLRRLQVLGVDVAQSEPVQLSASEALASAQVATRPVATTTTRAEGKASP